MSELDVKKKIFSLQVKKYKQYGYHSTGQTKESAESFENLMGALNKIKTDLVSLSLVIEKSKFDAKNLGTTSEFREVLNHAIDAKKLLKQSAFKTFLPSELAEVKEIYNMMQEFITTISTFTQEEVDRETAYLDAVLQNEEGGLRMDIAREEMKANPDRDLINQLNFELNDIEQAIKESEGRIDYLSALSKGQLFPLYKRTIEELISLMKNKTLRNENQVYEFAKEIGGCSTCYNWLHADWIQAHQTQEYI
jgi:hypothetical protein